MKILRALLPILLTTGVACSNAAQPAAAPTTTTSGPVVYGDKWTGALKDRITRSVDERYVSLPSGVRACLVQFIQTSWTPKEFHTLSETDDPVTREVLAQKAADCGN